jgi:hypothetical protein
VVLKRTARSTSKTLDARDAPNFIVLHTHVLHADGSSIGEHSKTTSITATSFSNAPTAVVRMQSTPPVSSNRRSMSPWVTAAALRE